MGKYNIEKNEYTGGQCCVFEHNGQHFYADRSRVYPHGLETVIFYCDRYGKVSNWGDLYCDRSGKQLEECIDEFISSEPCIPESLECYEEEYESGEPQFGLDKIYNFVKKYGNEEVLSALKEAEEYHLEYEVLMGALRGMDINESLMDWVK